MNILPKKSWHVLSRDNLERVRRDEEEAKRIEDEKAKRAALAEQEARVEFMRQRARTEQIKGQYEDLIRGAPLETPSPRQTEEKMSGQSKGVSTSYELISDGRHINFFADMKTAGVGLEGSVNIEHEQEKKKEQETWEKKTGILTYLVDKESGSSSEPWYAKKKDKGNKRSHEDRKALMDPLNDMKSYIEAKRKCLDPPQTISSQTSKISSSTGGAVQTSSHDDITSSSSKSKKKKKKKDKEKEKASMMEKLRAERRRREETERARSEIVMKKHYGLLEDDKQEETAGRYNNQFNPHLSRTK